MRVNPDFEFRAVYVLPLPPGGANRMWRTARGITYTPKPVSDWKRAVSAALIADGAAGPHDGEFSVLMRYHPAGRKKPSKRPLRRMDVDAVIKPILDALSGHVWRDDYQVIEVASELGDPHHEGRVLVEVWARP